MKRKPQWLILASIPLVLLLLLEAVRPGILRYGFMELRPANELEFAYSYLAADSKQPGLCEKIFSGSHLTAAWGADGMQISLTRSECYHNVAVTMENTELCEEVKPISSLLLDGSKITQKNCRKEVEESQGHLGSGGGDRALLSKIMRYPFEGNEIEIGSNFISLDETSADFIRRLEYLPDFSKAKPQINEKDYGCDTTQSEDWFCMYIECFNAQDFNYREACLQTVSLIRHSFGRDREQRVTAGELMEEYSSAKKIFTQYPELKERYRAGSKVSWNHYQNSLKKQK